MLDEIKKANPWIDEKRMFADRALFKYLIMIKLYGGTRSNRKTQNEKFITDFCMEMGTRFNSEEDHSNLGEFIEIFYKLYIAQQLYGMNYIRNISKYLAKKNRILTIKNPYFIC